MKHFFACSGGRNQIIPGFGLTMGMSITMLSLLILMRKSGVGLCNQRNPERERVGYESL